MDVTRSLVAADTSPPPALDFKLRSGRLDRLRSAETDRFAAGVVEFLETRGDGKRREGVGVGIDDEFDEVEGEGEGEGDKYLEETCLDLGLVGLFGPVIPLSFSEGSNGGLDWFVDSEMAATII